MILAGKSARDSLDLILNKDKNLFAKGYFKEGSEWTAFDNYSGNCYVENFYKEEIAIAWLENYFEMSEIDDFKISKIFRGFYYIEGKGFLVSTFNKSSLKTILLSIGLSFSGLSVRFSST